MHVQINGVTATVTQRSADGAWLATFADGRHMQLGPEVGEAALEGFALVEATWTDGPTHMEGGGRPTPRGAATIVHVEVIPAAADADDSRPFETSARTTIAVRRASGQPVTIKVLQGFRPEIVDVQSETIEEQKARLRGNGAQSPGRAQWLANLEAAVVKAEHRLESARLQLAKARGSQ